MAQYRFLAQGRWFSSGGSAEVTHDGVVVGRVELTPGGLLRGPTWHFRGLDLSWSMTSSKGGRHYDLVGADGAPVGTITSPMFSSDLSIATADGQAAALPGAAVFSSGRDRELVLPHGLQGALVRERQGLAGMFSSKESWLLTLPDDVAGQLRACCLGVPMVVDHHRRLDDDGGGD